MIVACNHSAIVAVLFVLTILFDVTNLSAVPAFATETATVRSKPFLFLQTVAVSFIGLLLRVASAFTCLMVDFSAQRTPSLELQTGNQSLPNRFIVIVVTQGEFFLSYNLLLFTM